MANYLVRFYDRNGRLISETVERYPSNVGRFQANKTLDKRDGYKSTYRSKKTKSGINRKVYYSESVNMRDGSRVVSTLIENRTNKRNIRRR